MAIAFGIICIIYGVFGITLNLAVAYAIFTDKSMQNATYTFMIQLALIDVEAIIGMVFGPGLYIVAQKFKEPTNFLVRLCMYFNACGFHSSAIWMTIIAFSRWAHFSKMQFLKRILSKRNIIIICVFVWVSIHIFYSPFLYSPGAPIPLGNDTGAYMYMNATVSQVIWYFDQIESLVAIFFQILFHTLAIGCVIRMRKQVLTPELRNMSVQEIKLLVQCAIDSLVFIILFSLFNIVQIFDLQLDILIEIFILLNHTDCALMYLFFNKKLRTFFKQLLKKSTEVSQIRDSTVMTKVKSIRAPVSMPA
jgi:hypothetical protein